MKLPASSLIGCADVARQIFDRPAQDRAREAQIAMVDRAAGVLQPPPQDLDVALAIRTVGERHAWRRTAKANTVTCANGRVKNRTIGRRRRGDVGLSDLLQAIPEPNSASSAAISSRLVHMDKVSTPILCKNCAPWPAPLVRGLVSILPGTAADLGPLKYPHMPAAIRDASATYAKQPAFTLGLPNGSQGSITFEETDRLSDQFAVYLARSGGLQGRRSRRDPDAELPRLSDRGVRHAEGRPGDGQHQSALHHRGNGAPVHRQRRGRTDRDRSVRDQGRRGAAEDVDQARLSWSAFRICCRRSSGSSCSAVQKYVKKMVPPITFAHTTMASGAGAGRRSHRGRRRSEGLRGLAESRQHRGAAVHRRHDRRGEGRGAHARQPRREHDAGPRDVEAVSSLRRGSDADRAAAVPHLRVHREPDDLLSRRRTQRARAEPAAALEPEDGDAERADHVVHRRQHAVCGLDARAVVQGEERTGRCADRWPAAWRSCR